VWDTVFGAWLRTSKANSNDAVFVFSAGGGNLEKNISANIVHALKEANLRMFYRDAKAAGYKIATRVSA